VIEYAAHAMLTMTSSWHQPSAVRGYAIDRAITDPTVLPIPSPNRNTARISEKVYTVAPSISDSRRVHTTSDPSAVTPDSAIVR
jgi:hypothetical protein